MKLNKLNSMNKQINTFDKKKCHLFINIKQIGCLKSQKEYRPEHLD